MRLYRIEFHYIAMSSTHFSFFFFFNDTATTEIYTLSLHDALPISAVAPDDPLDDGHPDARGVREERLDRGQVGRAVIDQERSEEHTSELQSRQYLVCRLLLEKKKKRMVLSTNEHRHTRRIHHYNIS